MTFHRCFLPSFGSFGHAVSEEKIFLEIDQSETRIASETGWPIELKPGIKHLWAVLYKEHSFRSDPLTDMAATGHSCF
jgi:hypothetical protein